MSFQEYWRKLYEEKKKKEPKIIRPILVVPEKPINDFAIMLRRFEKEKK
jgi:hypothetical protein